MLVAVSSGPPGLTLEAARAEQSLRECVARGELELRPEHLLLALRPARGRNVRTAA